ncbi:MAG: hypothetical protein J6W51_08755 [Fibrobacter sp.]|nr:hypothetical protein [Fibrobacter sp.]
MTLLVVEKKDDHIYVASDSRFSLGTMRIDCGTKIFKSNCTIRSLQGTVATFNIGFAFTGSVTNFFNFKNRIDFVLRNVFIEINEDCLNDIVIELIKKEYQSLCSESREALDVEGEVLFFMPSINNCNMSAYCLKFDPNTLNISLNTITDPYTFYGSGKDTAASMFEILHPQNYKNIVRFTKKVIDSHQDDTIGGNVQIGELTFDDFRILGYQDFEVNNVDFGPFYYYGSAKLKEHENFLPLDASFLEIYSPEELDTMSQQNTAFVMQSLQGNS